MRLKLWILRQDIIWRDCQVDGEVVKSPVDIDALLPGVYCLTQERVVTHFDIPWAGIPLLGNSVPVL